MQLRPWQQHVILWLLVIIAYAQVISMTNILQWDMVDQFFPWRRFIAENLNNGIIPMWNPYEHGGYPIHADPQAGVWYPVTWIMGFLTHYSTQGIQIEFILHLMIAASGMLILGSTVGHSTTASMIIAMAYALGGVFTSNAQHMTWIVSAAWLPFTIAAFLQYINSFRIRHVVKFAFFLSMMITGGYPGFLFILFYFLLALVAVRGVSWYRKKQHENWLKLLLGGTIAVAVVLVLTVGFLLSVKESMPLMLRGSGVTEERALFGPFSPRAMISFFTPYATVKDGEFFGTDISMANAYSGLLPLAFFLLAMIRRINRKEWTFMLFGTFCLAAAWGDALPVRKLLYDFVPFMDMFRFPSLFRIFALVAFLVPAGFSIDYVLAKRRTRIVSALIILMGTAFTGLVLYFLDQTTDLSPTTAGPGLIRMSAESGKAEHVVFQGVIQLVMLASLLGLLYYGRNKRLLPVYMLIFTAVDMVMAVQLNLPYTVVSEFSPIQSERLLEPYPSGFPVPENIKMIDTKDQGIPGTPFWRNTNMYFKRISGDGYNPFVLNNFDLLYNSAFRDSIWQNPWIFLSKDIQIAGDMTSMSEMAVPNNRTLVIASDQLSGFPFTIPSSAESSAADKINITDFSPNGVTAAITVLHTRFLTIMQNDYPGWHAYIDGKETPRLTTCFSMQSVLVPQGQHTVEFRYEKPWVTWTFILALIMFPAVAVYYFLSGRKTKKVLPTVKSA
ncbi:MAG: hypothetical protein H6585_11990 [Flavobacteriales bacterium]|nr:hypothetical protein [Flavobacteriales bacterium]MCB9449051.1 hypothetical protein [Flavobacteriales bacterium]